MEKTNPEKHGNWIQASKLSVLVHGESKYFAKKVWEWGRSFINDREEILENKYGQGNKSAIDNEDLAQEIHLHLQRIGKYIKAKDIVHFCDTPEMLMRLKCTKTISLATARRWLEKMGYCWKCNLKGQYVDGHKRQDVVDYCQNIFLPAIMEFEG